MPSVIQSVVSFTFWFQSNYLYCHSEGLGVGVGVQVVAKMNWPCLNISVCYRKLQGESSHAISRNFFQILGGSLDKWLKTKTPVSSKMKAKYNDCCHAFTTVVDNVTI